MTIDLRESYEGDSGGALNKDSIWRGEERRENPRTEIDEVAYLSSGGASTRCRVLNISADGAAIDVPNATFVPDRFQLMTETDRRVRRCQVVWIKQNRIGVAFVKDSDAS
ncbi:PilZ domain-containing protein [Bradyrhizobium sp. dw_411]|uniref:PilZ domain-containing protein n=1 Tax=Bradyrhizobium sp. dw_411 TaxID=2720082 RepID=UPI001BCB47A3|nr:PilZ domain-containing protein [Bradyrhizobium sp. dw_411]